MTDTVSGERRSWIMSRVKGKDTAPELFVRSLVHRLGYRFRLHRRDLPGAPDLVFVSRGKVIFVHGCFWHGHNCVRGDRQPKSNSDYWKRKIAKNKERDRSRRTQLRDLGWDVLVVWECQLRDEEKLAQELIAFLGDRPARRSNS